LQFFPQQHPIVYDNDFIITVGTLGSRTLALLALAPNSNGIRLRTDFLDQRLFMDMSTLNWAANTWLEKGITQYSGIV